MKQYCQKATPRCPFPETLDKTVVCLILQDSSINAVLMQDLLMLSSGFCFYLWTKIISLEDKIDTNQEQCIRFSGRNFIAFGEMKWRLLFNLWFTTYRPQLEGCEPEPEPTSASVKINSSRLCNTHLRCNGPVPLRDPGSANVIVREKGLFIDWEKVKEVTLHTRVVEQCQADV